MFASKGEITPPWGGTAFRLPVLIIFDVATTQPLFDYMKYLAVNNAPGNKLHEFRVVDSVEVLHKIHIVDFGASPVEVFVYFPDRVMRAFLGSEPKT
jgi:hypothetical protein